MNTENNIKIGVTGKILKGRHTGWYIFFEDDFENTGGYLILLFNNIDRFKSSKGYDYWAEDKSSLIELCQEAKWKVEWLDPV